MTNRPIESFHTVAEVNAEIMAVTRALEERVTIQLHLNTVHELAREVLSLVGRNNNESFFANFYDESIIGQPRRNQPRNNPGIRNNGCNGGESSQGQYQNMSQQSASNQYSYDSSNGSNYCEYSSQYPEVRPYTAVSHYSCGGRIENRFRHPLGTVAEEGHHSLPNQPTYVNEPPPSYIQGRPYYPYYYI